MTQTEANASPKDAALRLALVEINRLCDTGKITGATIETIQAIKAALEAKDEPVAWRTFDGEGGYDYRTYENNEDYADEWDKRNPKHKGWVEPLYTTPPQRTWVGLTDEDKNKMAFIAGSDKYWLMGLVEKKLKELNT